MPNAFPRYLCLNTLGAVQLGEGFDSGGPAEVSVEFVVWARAHDFTCYAGADYATVRLKEKIHVEHRIGKQFYLVVSNFSGFSSNWYEGLLYLLSGLKLLLSKTLNRVTP